MKREALLRELRALARKQNVFFEIKETEGKGSHYVVRFGENKTIIKSGELNPLYVKIIKKTAWNLDSQPVFLWRTSNGIYISYKN